MARLTNVRLNRVGRVNSSIEFAEVSVTVSWTGREVQENYWYLVNTFLFERDDSFDIYQAYPAGNGLVWHPRGDRDDYVGNIGSQWVKPNGATSRTFTFRRNWDFGNQEAGNEEYRAVATIVPETRGDLRSSNEISVNVG